MPGRLLFSIESRTGNNAASVLPEPVGAMMIKSEPRRTSAIAESCIGFSCAIPDAASNDLAIDLTSFLVAVGGKAAPKEPPVIN